MSALRVELFWNEEAGNWHYRVPALYINGGGTREDAERESSSAMAFALEGIPATSTLQPKPSPRCQGRIGRLNPLLIHLLRGGVPGRLLRVSRLGPGHARRWMRVLLRRGCWAAR
jgi:hypothetical protein